MSTLTKDVRFGLRRLTKSPGFTAVAVISLALGIGANTAIFSLVNAMLVRPLPVSNPEQLVSVSVSGKNETMLAFSYPNYIDFRDRSDVLSGLIVHRFAPISLSRGGSNERVWGYLVSGNYFDVLGVKPVLGRTFLPEEDRTRRTHPVIVISYGCWKQRFGGDPGIIDKEILLNSRTFRIIGVAPEDFKGTERIYTPEIWAPVMMVDWIEPDSTWLEDRGSQNMFATGRLKPGVSYEQAEASLNILADQLGKEYPDVNEGQTIKLIPPGFIIPSLRTGIIAFSIFLMVGMGLVLLIACTNLASLLLARATGRTKEIAIRLSLGASRLRLVRQLLVESILLSLVGGAAGVLIALWIIRAADALGPPIDFPLTIDLKMDWRVLGFSVVASLVTAVVFGLAPALRATKPDLVSALKDTVQQSGLVRSPLMSILIVLQFAISLFLLIFAGLVVRALQHLQTTSPGFDPENALVMSVDLSLQGYNEAQGQEFYRRLIERLESLPSVKSASMTSMLPLSLNYSSNRIHVEGQPEERGANSPTALVADIGSGYFETMLTPILAGREFSIEDTVRSPMVVVVNEAFVREYMSGSSNEDAVGKRINFGRPESPYRSIIGVVKTGKYFYIGEEPRPFVFSPVTQSYSAYGTLIVRTSVDPKAMSSIVRSEVQSLDPNLPVFDLKTMTEHMSLALFPARVAAMLLGGFGLLALVLAAIGIHGVTAYSVAMRTREIGIRMAIGARGADVLKMVMRQGLVLAGAGMALGLGITLTITFLISSLISSQLYGISSTDPLTFIATGTLLIIVALVACLIPARRAATLDPLIALRYE